MVHCSEHGTHDPASKCPRRFASDPESPGLLSHGNSPGCRTANDSGIEGAAGTSHAGDIPNVGRGCCSRGAGCPVTYDTVYIALAELLDAPLLTCDRKIALASGHPDRGRQSSTHSIFCGYVAKLIGRRRGFHIVLMHVLPPLPPDLLKTGPLADVHAAERLDWAQRIL